MEGELQIQSSLMAPPKQDIASLAKSQLGFMNLFAIPLFQGVADIMPAMRHTVEEIEMNKDLFQRKLEEEKAKEAQEIKNDPAKKRLLMKEGTFSPRTMSYAVGMEDGGKDSGQHGPRTVGSLDNLVIHDTSSRSLMNGDIREEDESPSSQPTVRAGNIRYGREGKEANGRVPAFDAVQQLANSDPFNSRRDGRPRGSDGTADSAGATTADGSSYLTSGAASKMPLSPSTKGTSIVSRESGGERPASAPGFKSTYDAASSSKDSDWSKNDGSMASGGVGRPEGKTLRKKGSRFRMKDFPFFRRNKGSPFSTTTGEPAN